jgi:very-short-patch-repair endonuclease
VRKVGRRRTGMKMKCETCGREFEVRDYEKGKRRFCSYQCYWEYRKRRVVLICLWCGKKFETLPSEIRKGGGKFCCRECFEKYRQSEGYRRKISKVVREMYEQNLAYREKVSESIRRKWEDPEYREKILQAKRSLGYKEKMSKVMRLKSNSPECKKKRSEKMKAKYQDSEYCNKWLEIIYSVNQSPERRRKISESVRKLWQDPEYRNKVVKAIAEALQIKPNGLEKAVCDLLQSYFTNEWCYVGDGKVFIAGFVPDFIHKEEKWIVEVNGDYWHSLSEAREKDRRKRETYEKYGYKVLEVWESEFRSDPMVVVNKICGSFYSDFMKW